MSLLKAHIYDKYELPYEARGDYIPSFAALFRDIYNIAPQVIWTDNLYRSYTVH